MDLNKDLLDTLRASVKQGAIERKRHLEELASNKEKEKERAANALNAANAIIEYLLALGATALECSSAKNGDAATVTTNIPSGLKFVEFDVLASGVVLWRGPSGDSSPISTEAALKNVAVLIGQQGMD